MKQQSESAEIIDSVPEQPVTAKPRDGIQWGGVIKGVAIVAAVALVGVAAFWLAHAAAVAALGVPQVAGAAQAVITATAPIANAATGVTSYLAGFLPHVPNIIGGFFSNLFGMEAAATTATTLSAANSEAIANAVGGLGSGAALAGSAVLAAPAIHHAMMPDTSHATAGHVAGMDASHSSHTTTNILKTSHVAAENSQEARAAERAAKLRAAQANRSWVDKARASRAEGGFAEQLNADRARLDAALADPAR
jgi:hypothetical protein